MAGEVEIRFPRSDAEKILQNIKIFKINLNQTEFSEYRISTSISNVKRSRETVPSHRVAGFQSRSSHSLVSSCFRLSFSAATGGAWGECEAHPMSVPRRRRLRWACQSIRLWGLYNIRWACWALKLDHFYQGVSPIIGHFVRIVRNSQLNFRLYV